MMTGLLLWVTRRIWNDHQILNKSRVLLTWFDSVEHGQSVVGGQCRDVQVVDGGLLCCQRRQLMEVSGEQAEAPDLGGDVFADGPGQTEAVVRGSASAELVDYDERALCGRAADITWKPD